MFNDNPEAFMKDFGEVREKITAPVTPPINSRLLAEAQRINAGKVIDIKELDKPLF